MVGVWVRGRGRGGDIGVSQDMLGKGSPGALGVQAALPTSLKCRQR